MEVEPDYDDSELVIVRCGEGEGRSRLIGLCCPLQAGVLLPGTKDNPAHSSHCARVRLLYDCSGQGTKPPPTHHGAETPGDKVDAQHGVGTQVTSDMSVLMLRGLSEDKVCRLHNGE